MNDRPTRVVKVGGSLFDLPDLPDRLRSWLANQIPARNVLVAGGGPLVDALRRLDRQRSIGESTCHWLAIDLMDIAARVLGAWMPEAVVVRDGRDIESIGRQNPISILEPGVLIREIESNGAGVRLRQNWDVTSDSIAAAVASGIHAPELVLLKSDSPPGRLGADTATHLAEIGYVDPSFPDMAKGIPTIRFVNLRARNKP